MVRCRLYKDRYCLIVPCNWLFRLILRGYAGITIYPFIFMRYDLTKDGKSLDFSTAYHESIHIDQYIRYLVIGFPFAYAYHSIKAVIKHRHAIASGAMPLHTALYYKNALEAEAFTITAKHIISMDKLIKRSRNNSRK